MMDLDSSCAIDDCQQWCRSVSGASTAASEHDRIPSRKRFGSIDSESDSIASDKDSPRCFQRLEDIQEEIQDSTFANELAFNVSCERPWAKAMQPVTSFFVLWYNTPGQMDCM